MIIYTGYKQSHITQCLHKSFFIEVGEQESSVMASSSENRINHLSRQLRRAVIELPERRRVVGSQQTVDVAAQE